MDVHCDINQLYLLYCILKIDYSNNVVYIIKLSKIIIHKYNYYIIILLINMNNKITMKIMLYVLTANVIFQTYLIIR